MPEWRDSSTAKEDSDVCAGCPKYILGCSLDSAALPTCYDESRVLYRAGKHLVFLNTTSNEVSILAAGQNCSRVLGFAVSSSRKHAAVVESTLRGAKWQVSIINLQTEEHIKSLSGKAISPSPDPPSALCFSEDGKVVAAMCSSPVPLLWAWHISSGGVIARYILSSTFTSLSCRPGPGSQWAACGQAGVRVWDLAADEGEFREVPFAVQAGDDLVTAHVWLPGGCHGACTAGGKILLQQEQGEVALLAPNLGLLTAMAGMRHGFAVGDSSGGVALFAASSSRSRSKEYRLVRQVAGEASLGCLRHISVSPGEEALLLVGAQGGMALLSLDPKASSNPSGTRSSTPAPSMALLNAGTGTVAVPHDRRISGRMSKSSASLRKSLVPGLVPREGPGTGEDIDGGNHGVEYKLLTTCFHAGGLISMAVSSVQPLLVTLGTDLQLRVWDYEVRRLLFQQQMESGTSCLALHPLGFHVAVGSSGGISFTLITGQGLVELASYLLVNCATLAFSHGGSFLAGSCSSGRLVHIFSTTTLQPVHVLQAVTPGVTSLSWSPDDTVIFACCSGGTCCSWTLCGKSADLSGDRLEQVDRMAACPGSAAGTVLRTTEGRLIGLDGAELKAGLRLDPGSGMDLVCSSGAVVAAGTAGRVLACRLDGPAVAAGGGFREVYTAVGSVTHMAATCDTLFIASDDGLLLLLSLREDSQQTGPKPGPSMALMTYQEASAIEARAESLAGELASMQMQRDYQLALQERQHAEQLRQKDAAVQSSRELAEARLEEIGRVQSLGLAALRDAQSAADTALTAELEALRRQLTVQMQDEQRKGQGRESELAGQLEGARALFEDANRGHQQAMQQQFREAEKLVQTAVKERDRALAQAEAASLEYSNTLEQCEAEFQLHFDRVDCQAREEREDAEQRIMELKGRSHLLKTAAIRLRNKEADDERRISLLEATKVDFESKVKESHAQVDHMREQIRERENVISQNYESIQLLRRRVADLEKHKFVLTYRTQELEGELEPKEELVQDLSRQMEVCDQEVLALVTRQEKMQNKAESKAQLAASARKQAESLRHQLAERDARMAVCAAELATLLADVYNTGATQDTASGSSSSRGTPGTPRGTTGLSASQRRRRLEALCRKMEAYGRAPEPLEPAVQQELERQREAVEMKNAILRKRLETSEELHRRQLHRMMRDNQSLLHLSARASRDAVALKHRLSAAETAKSREPHCAQANVPCANSSASLTQPGVPVDDAGRLSREIPCDRPSTAVGRTRTRGGPPLPPRPTSADATRRPSTLRGRIAVGSPARVLAEAIAEEGRRLALLLSTPPHARPQSPGPPASLPCRAPTKECASSGVEDINQNAAVPKDAANWTKTVQGLVGILQWPEEETHGREKKLPRPWTSGGAWTWKRVPPRVGEGERNIGVIGIMKL
eukprot:jgi/Botrbrau1/6640/Bobra.104_2s0027.1